MARVSIYVPDDLKGRMDAAGDAINWSEVARPAFVSALANHEHRKGKTMTTAIERLRASKAQFLSNTEQYGKQSGHSWAENRASYGELKSVSAIDLTNFAPDDTHGTGEYIAIASLRHALDSEMCFSTPQLLEILFGVEDVSPEAVYAFIDGAQEFFAEVEGQL